jgi:hypothetical protein
MTVQDRQDSIQKRVVAKQLQDNAKNIDPVLLIKQPRSGRVKAPSKCSKCGSFRYTARICSL